MDATTFAALGVRQPQTSKHLGVLRNAGIVDVESVARRRIHHLRAEPFAETGDWLDSFEELWESRLDSLGAFLSSRQGSAQSADREGAR